MGEAGLGEAGLGEAGMGEAGLLGLEDLHVAYGDTIAVRGVDLTVAAGEAVALIGPNGAGKTALLRAVCGLLPPIRGGITYAGTSIVGTPTHALARRGLAYVPAERRLFPAMSVAENLALGAYPDRPDPTRLEGVVRLFPRLAERRSQAAGTMSGGEQQMLAIGRALMAAPRLLLLDEPSTGLAPQLAEEVYAALGALRADEGTTILLAEQQVPLALGLVDRGYVLEGGCIQLTGSAAQLRSDPGVRRAYLGLA